MLKKTIIIGEIICNSFVFAFNISICKVMEHEAINSVVTGIKDELANENVSYDIETCQADSVLGYQMAAKFVNSNTDLIVTVGTTPSQSVFKFAKQKKTKLVFSSVTNPGDISRSFGDTNTTGVSNFVDLKPQLELFKKLQPNLKELGIIYNSGETNSTSLIKNLMKLVDNLE